MSHIKKKLITIIISQDEQLDCVRSFAERNFGTKPFCIYEQGENWDDFPGINILDYDYLLLVERINTDFWHQFLLDDILESHRVTQAYITMPDKSWIPGFDFKLFSTSQRSRKEKIPDILSLGQCRVNYYVPSISIIADSPILQRFYYKKQKSVHVSISETCDMRCRMCPFYGSDRSEPVRHYYDSYMNRRKGNRILTLPSFRKMYKRLTGFQKVTDLSIFGPGEPLKNKEFLKILQYCTDHDTRVSFATNGLGLTQSLIDSFKDIKLGTVILSLDATNEKTYTNIKPNGNFPQIKSFITNLQQVRNDGAQFNFTLSFIRQHRNSGEEDSFVNTWLKYADDVVFTSMYYMGQPYDKPAWVPHEKLPCGSLINGIHYLTDGKCWSCSAGVPDEFSLGNIFTDNSDQVLKLHNQYIEKQLYNGIAGDICENCTWWYQTHHCEEYENGSLKKVLRPYSTKIIS